MCCFVAVSCRILPPKQPLKRSHNAGDQWQTILSPAGNLESRKNRDAYIADVTSCLDSLRRGDSYELCLTTQLRKKVKISPEELYSRLRASNPSAHAAWLSFGSSLPTVSLPSLQHLLKQNVSYGRQYPYAAHLKISICSLCLMISLPLTQIESLSPYEGRTVTKLCKHPYRSFEAPSFKGHCTCISIVKSENTKIS